MTFEDIGIQTKGKVGRFYMVCPKCVDARKAENKKKECLTVNNEPNNQWFSCHNCEWKGNLKAYERSEKIYAKAHMPIVKTSIFTKPISEFLALRQISPSTALNLGIYEWSFKAKNGEEINAICYPYYVNHSLRNVMFRRVDYVKGVSKGPREWQIKYEEGQVETESVFWGLNEYDREHNECIIVEGQTDRMTWVECGFKNVLSVPMGGINPNSKDNEKKLSFINDEFREITSQCKKFFIFTDNDEVGKATREALAQKLGKNKCYRSALPFKYKDSNEVYAGNVEKGLDPLGRKGIEDIFNSAQPYPVEGIITVLDLSEEIDSFVKGVVQKGYLVGEKNLDSVLSIKEKLMMVVTGIPAMGKSTWVRWYATQLSKHNPELSWGMFTPENRPPQREIVKICECYQGQTAMQNYNNAMSTEQLNRAKQWTHEHFKLISPERRNFFSFQKEAPKTLKNLFGYIRTLRDQYGITGFIIDAFNKIEHERESKMAEDLYIGMILDMILEFLDYENMMGIIVAHPYKMESLPSGNFRIPNLYNIKGSSAWNERTDIGVVVHRNKFVNENENLKGVKEKWVRDQYAPTIIDIAKMKFDELGQEETIEMFLNTRAGYRFQSDKPKYYSEAKVKEEPKIEEDFSDVIQSELPF